MNDGSALITNSPKSAVTFSILADASSVLKSSFNSLRMIIGDCIDGKVYYIGVKILNAGNYTLKASTTSSSTTTSMSVLPQILHSIVLNSTIKSPCPLFRFTIEANLYDEDGDPLKPGSTLSLISTPQVSGTISATSSSNLFKFSVIAQIPGKHSFFCSLSKITANLTLFILPNSILINSTILSSTVSII